MSYEIQPGEKATITLVGAQTLEELAHLRTALWELLNQGSKELCVNFAQRDKLDPSIISLLVSTKNLATKFKAELRLEDLNDNCLAVFEELNMTEYFDLATESSA